MEKTILSGSGIPKHIEVQRKSFADDDVAFIEAIPGIVFAVVISYVYLNVGTYMNGTLGSELTQSFPNNIKSGLINTDTWYNGTTQNASIVVNLTSYNTAEQLNGAISKFYIRATGAFSIYYNLTVNNVVVNNSSLLPNGEGYNHTMTTLVAAGVTGATLTFAWDANSTASNVQIRLQGAYFTTTDQRTSLENNTVNTMSNLSDNYNSNVDIVKIAITISVLLVPIMAIMSLRRYT